MPNLCTIFVNRTECVEKSLLVVVSSSAMDGTAVPDNLTVPSVSESPSSSLRRLRRQILQKV